MKKLSQLLTLMVSALTLVILLIFIGQAPDYSTYVTEKKMTQTVQDAQKTIEEKMGEVENLNGLDALNEKYTQLASDHKDLQSSYDDLKSEVEALKTKQKTEPVKKPAKEETKKEEPKKPEVLKNETVSVTSDFLNFRNEASLSAPIRTVLPNGTKMEVLDKTVLEKDGYKWVKVGLENGETGFVAREYVS